MVTALQILDYFSHFIREYKLDGHDSFPGFDRLFLNHTHAAPGANSGSYGVFTSESIPGSGVGGCNGGGETDS
jgi:hypothetical protein